MSKIFKGIDVSSWQKNIDWEKISNQINFVIIRSGFGNSISQTDSMFKNHIAGAIKAGIKNIGIYHFSYAKSEAEARQEAKICLQIIEKYKNYVNMPIAFDWEYDSYNYALKNGVKPTKALCDKMALAFCDEIEKAGFKAMLYTNPDYAERFFTISKYKYLWIAQYAEKCDIPGVDIWQYTSSGKLDGYSGNLDMNYCYNESLINKNGEENMMTVYKKGDENIGILACKKLLLQLYGLQALTVKVDDNGKFGAGTEKAVKEAQALYGLAQTGQIDVKTVNAMQDLIDKYKPIKGDFNGDGKIDMKDVTDIQKEIAK